MLLLSSRAELTFHYPMDETFELKDPVRFAEQYFWAAAKNHSPKYLQYCLSRKPHQPLFSPNHWISVNSCLGTVRLDVIVCSPYLFMRPLIAAFLRPKIRFTLTYPYYSVMCVQWALWLLLLILTPSLATEQKPDNTSCSISVLDDLTHSDDHLI